LFDLHHKYADVRLSRGDAHIDVLARGTKRRGPGPLITACDHEEKVKNGSRSWKREPVRE